MRLPDEDAIDLVIQKAREYKATIHKREATFTKACRTRRHGAKVRAFQEYLDLADTARSKYVAFLNACRVTLLDG